MVWRQDLMTRQNFDGAHASSIAALFAWAHNRPSQRKEVRA